MINVLKGEHKFLFSYIKKVSFPVLTEQIDLS